MTGRPHIGYGEFGHLRSTLNPLPPYALRCEGPQQGPTSPRLPCRSSNRSIYMTHNTAPLPYEVQEMTTTEARKHSLSSSTCRPMVMSPQSSSATADGWPASSPEEDVWVYSPAWQEQLRQAESDLADDRTQTFADDEEFLRRLDAVDDEAGG